MVLGIFDFDNQMIIKGVLLCYNNKWNIDGSRV